MIKTIPGEQVDPIQRLGTQKWTYEDLSKMPESMEHFEIIDGDLYMSPSAHVMQHQSAVTQLVRYLANWADAHNAGKVFTAPADVVIAPRHVVQPDVFFLATERLHLVDAFVSGPPDLVIEVISPSSVHYDRVVKYGLYEAIGVKEYWLVDPKEQSVEVHVAQGGHFVLQGRFVGSDTFASVVLDGFVLAVAEVFA